MLDVIKKLRERFTAHAEAEQFDVRAMRIDAAREHVLEAARTFGRATRPYARDRALGQLMDRIDDMMRAEGADNV